MTERLLHFIWQFQYFNKGELTTAAGDSLQIIAQGQYNTNQGPDFTNAKIMIGKTVWAGTIELHINTSDWDKHEHTGDGNYRNVILHVVWNDDKGISNEIPLLVLKDRVSKILLARYEELMNNSSFIACENKITEIRELTWNAWKDRLVAERLLRKSQSFEILVSQSNQHWEESFWWLLARNFGMKVNADAFEAIAKSIPLTILAKHKNQIHQLEALLLGQANLLEGDFKDSYPLMLQKEYRFLQKKYALPKVHIPVHFLRMRPGNFPTIRLAQLSMLINDSSHLFSKIKDADSLKEVRSWFDITANDYWHYHYQFDEETAFKKKTIGADMLNNLVINTIVPVLFAYGDYHGDDRFKSKAVKWLEETLGEVNSITKQFASIGIASKTAFESQALIELKNEYCTHRKCLDCAVGNYLLKQDKSN